MGTSNYLPSHLGEIPDDWKRVKFADVMKVRQGLQISISERLTIPTSTSKEYITIQSIKKHDQPREYVETPSPRVICNKNDVLMTRTGNTGIVVTDVSGVFHNNFFLMDFQRDKIEKLFLVNYLRTTRVQHLILTKAGASTIPDLNHNDFYAIEFPLAPLPEQQKIAKILSAWDKAIVTTEKLISTSKSQKKALMQQLLTGRKRLINPETGKAFEGAWERHSLSDLAYIDKKSLGKKTPEDFEFRYISLSDVNVGVISQKLEKHKLSTSPSRARRVLQAGDVLMSTVRPNLKGFAKVSEAYEDCIASTGFSILSSKKQVSGDYIYQYIFSAHITGQIDSLVVGSNYPAINSSDVSGLKVYCPRYAEQQKIASVLTAADKEIELLQAKLAHLKQEKKALMLQLLTGKRRVKVDLMEAV